MPDKLKWFLLIIVLLTGSKYAKAQYYDYWAFGYHFGLKFNTCPLSVERNVFSSSYSNTTCISSTICDSLGNLLLYTNGRGVFSADGKLIENGTLNKDAYSFDQAILIPKGKSSYYVFVDWDTAAIVNNKPHVPLPISGLYSSVIRKDNNGRFAIQPWEKEIPVFLTYSLTNVTAIKGASEDYWLICRSSDTLFACDFDSVGLRKIVKTVIPEPLNNNLTTAYFNYPSNNGKSLLTVSTCAFDDFTTNESNIPQQGSYAYLYSFDNVSGKFSDQKLIDFHHRTSKHKNFYFTAACFSPNDSLIYLIDTYGGYKEDTVNLAQYQIRENNLRDSKTVLSVVANRHFGLYDIKLGPNGKIYIINVNNCSLSQILAPDKIGVACNFKENILDMNCYDGKHNAYPYYFTNTPNSYLKLRYRVGTTCGYLNVAAESDTLFHTYQWDISSANGYTYHNEGAQASAPVNREGWYRITLTGIAKTGYSKCYTDSFLVPARPKANFSVSTDSICAYNPIQFHDSSIVDTGRLSMQSRYWNFGDGQSSTSKDPQHIYTAAGSYTVRLVASDGICSGTFIYPKKIRIQDAPKPGFKPVPEFGCAPLHVQYNYRADAPGLKFKYYFGDGATDSVEAPLHVYDSAGVYTVHQYLYSPYGCITQDSEQVRVLQGVDISRPSDIKMVSVTGEHAIKVLWDSIPGASAYVISRMRDGVPSSQLVFYTRTDSFIDENTDAGLHTYTYLVQAQDTCQNITPKGLSGNNILLQARSVNDAYAHLQWQAYREWQAGVKQYIIQRSNDGKAYTSIAAMAGNQLEYDDKSFYADSLNYRSYRILAISYGTGVSSSSNTAKVPYNFTVWIPNSFSPNGDGLNDRFEIKAEKGTSLHLDIYNQWGEQVFSTNDINDSWDGTFRSGKAAEGIYLYKAEIKSPTSGNFYRTGTIQILK